MSTDDKFKPRRVVIDEDKDREYGRGDAYGSLPPSKKFEIDQYVDRRDRAVGEVDRAENDIDSVLKRARGKDNITGPSIIIADPPKEDNDVKTGPIEESYGRMKPC